MKKLSLSLLVIVLITFWSLPSIAAKQEAENYSATVNDGTASEMHVEQNIDDENEVPHTSPHTSMDASDEDPSLKTRLSARETELAKETTRHAATAAREMDREVKRGVPASEINPEALASLERKNTELQNRMTQLEALLAGNKEMKAHETIVATPVATPSPQKLSILAPAEMNPLDARMSEKRMVSQTARTQAAKKQALEEKKRFAQVPDERIRELSERLKYANDILKRYGRAYDYRVVTLTEFKKILTDLETAELGLPAGSDSETSSQL